MSTMVVGGREIGGREIIGSIIDSKEKKMLERLKETLEECNRNFVKSKNKIQKIRFVSVGASSCQRIPHHIRNVQPNAFDPQLVSFGPYHHGKLHLVQTEEGLKLEGFHRFIKRCNEDYSGMAMELCYMLEPLKEFYDQLDHDKWGDDALFLKLMAVDGCFMLEVLLSNEDDRLWLGNEVETIKRDMLLLENQLPMLLLHELFYNLLPPPPRDDFKWLVCKFLALPSPTELDQYHRDYFHILEMYREKLLHPRRSLDNRVINFEYDGDDHEDWHNSMATRPMILPTTRLKTAGITFEPNNTWSLWNVSFDSGVLKIPQLKLEDVTKAALFNVIAFETLNPNIGNEVTSFAVLMNDLINVDTDVTLLTEKKILLSHGFEDRDVAEFFNVLGKGAALNRSNRHFFDPVYKSIHNYCSKPWHEWWASLVQTNFKSPWTIISLIAASLGAVLLFLQTFYQVYGYHHPSPRP